MESGFKSPGGTHLSEIFESTSPGDNGNLEWNISVPLEAIPYPGLIPT